MWLGPARRGTYPQLNVICRPPAMARAASDATLPSQTAADTSRNRRIATAPQRTAMARLSHLPAATHDAAGAPPRVALAELSQLLSRLQESILHPAPERERLLRRSEYERARVEAVGRPACCPARAAR